MFHSAARLHPLTTFSYGGIIRISQNLPVGYLRETSWFRQVISDIWLIVWRGVMRQ
jgi:hypothetical protein